ncbi:Replicative DNA helicase [Candidatus Magnetomoraceae bacterium gMMP-15]
MGYNDEMMKKLPPQSIEAEQAILSAILIDSGDHSNSNTLSEVIESLSPHHFYTESHRKIFASIIELFNKHEPTDMIALLNKLEEKNELEAIGGAVYLGSLIKVPMAVNIKHYSEIIKKKAILRKLIKSSNSIITKCYQEQGDLSEIIDFSEKSIFEVANDKASSQFYSIYEVMLENFNSFEEKTKPGVPSGFIDLDNITLGFQPSDFIILAARPGCGKTSLALNFARNAAIDHKKHVVFFSLEMSKQQLGNRLLSSESKIPYSKLVKKSFSQEEFKLMLDKGNNLSNSSITIDETPNISIIEMRAKLRRITLRKPVDMVIIDYLQLMKMNNNAERHDLAVGEVSSALKAIAKEMNIPVIALSQLNRKVEERVDKRPKLSDLRDSGNLEQDADLVMFIYRDELYSKFDTSNGIAELLIRKHRNGPTGEIKLRFQAVWTRFKDYFDYNNKMRKK